MPRVTPSVGERNVLIVGAGKVGHELAQHLREHPKSGRSVCGFVDDLMPLGDEVHGRVSDLARIIRAQFVDEIILTPPYDSELIRRVAREARRNRIDVILVPELFGLAPRSVALSTLGGVPVLKLHEERLPAFTIFIKRALDVLLAGLVLMVTFPLLAAIAVAIRFESRGPALYRSVRIGKKGRSFIFYKFRTMICGAEQLQSELLRRNERQGPFFKIANDPRITRLGRLLRRYSLDELPQLWNVIKGDMSLVGPRPHPVTDFERYQLEHLPRLNVVPGLTGLWQITARQDPSFERNMELDLEYIENWNLWFDLSILLRTVPVLFRGTGA